MQPEVLYLQQCYIESNKMNFHFPDKDTLGRGTLHFVGFPLLIKVQLKDYISLHIGPQVNFLMNACRIGKSLCKLTLGDLTKCSFRTFSPYPNPLDSLDLSKKSFPFWVPIMTEDRFYRQSRWLHTKKWYPDTVDKKQ